MSGRCVRESGKYGFWKGQKWNSKDHDTEDKGGRQEQDKTQKNKDEFREDTNNGHLKFSLFFFFVITTCYY